LKQQQIGQDAGMVQMSMAIASPCSTCKNLSMDSDSGVPICPRRVWEQLRKAAVLAGSPPPPPYLTDSGFGATNGYTNPVTSQSTQARVVWAAAIEDNRPLLNIDGSVKNPDLLNPAFDSTFIQCRSTPYVPAMREGDYYAGSQIVEGDTLLLYSTKFSQTDSNNIQNSIMLGGYCQKVTAIQKFFLTPAKKTVNQQGT
jgi:hypothetical protein